jgi:hypothetical protein
MYHPQVYGKQLKATFHKFVLFYQIYMDVLYTVNYILFYQIYMDALYTVNYILGNQIGCDFIWQDATS